MLEPPQELALPAEDQHVSHHQYDEPLNMFGKDLITRLDCTKADLVQLVGRMLSKSEMQSSPFAASAIAAMNGELADEVHEWPNATLGEEFRHLVLLFRNDRLVGMKWSHQSLPKTSPGARKPWWKVW